MVKTALKMVRAGGQKKKLENKDDDDDDEVPEMVAKEGSCTSFVPSINRLPDPPGQRKQRKAKEERRWRLPNAGARKKKKRSRGAAPECLITRAKGQKRVRAEAAECQLKRAMGRRRRPPTNLDAPSWVSRKEQANWRLISSNEGSRTALQSRLNRFVTEEGNQTPRQAFESHRRLRTQRTADECRCSR